MQQQQHIVIVGGSGSIGQAIVAELTAQRVSSIIISRSPETKAPFPQDQRGLVQRVSYGELPAAMRDASAVINLAGANVGKGRWTHKRKREIVSSRLDVTRQIVDILKGMQKPPALIQASASGFYGNTSVPSNEAMGAGNTFLAQLCVEWEAQAKRAADVTRVAILRLGVVLSTTDGALHSMLFPMKIGLGGVLGNGNQGFPWISQRDAARAFVWAAHNEIHDVVNVVAPEFHTMRTFVRTLGTALKRPTIMGIPEIALYALLGSQAQIVCHGQHVVPNRLLGSSFQFLHPTLTHALNETLKEMS
jgi:uncharacterized protein